MSLLLACRMAWALAAVFAIALARRRPEHRPVAFFIAGTWAANMVRVAIRAAVFEPAREAIRARGLDPVDVPFEGAAVVWAGIETALWLTFPFGLVALAVALFGRQRWPLPVIATAWLATSLGIALAYPLTRGPVLHTCYVVAEGSALAAALLVFMRWLPRREGVGVARMTLMMLWGIDALQVIWGAYRHSLFERYDLATLAYLIAYLVIAAMQGVQLWAT